MRSSTVVLIRQIIALYYCIYMDVDIILCTTLLSTSRLMRTMLFQAGLHQTSKSMQQEQSETRFILNSLGFWLNFHLWKNSSWMQG